MRKRIKRCGIDPCLNYSLEQNKNYCFDGVSTIEVTKGNSCLLGYKTKYKKPEQTPQPTTHPFGEWGRNPLPFP